ncbi:MAG: EamA family transporter [Desulfobacterales bacterium]|nr:EamA family transporter [Desulfobacterales bacterium]
MTTKSHAPSPRLGYLYAILAAVTWAIGGAAAKFLFNSGVTTFQLVQLRITLAAAILFIWLLLRNPAALKISKSDIVYFMILGSVGMAAVQFAYLFAISKINVAAAILLEYLAPVFIALYMVIFAKEKLGAITVAAIVVAVAGCYLVVGAYNLNILSMNLAGIASGLWAGVAFAWFSVHGEYGMRKYQPWTVLFYALLCATIIWNIIHPPLQALFQPYTPVQWFWIFYIALMATVVPFGLYYMGINLIRSTRASITATLEPITAGIISYIFLNEMMELWQVLGGVLVIASIILLQLKQEQDEKAPGLLRAQKNN